MKKKKDKEVKGREQNRKCREERHMENNPTGLDTLWSPRTAGGLAALRSRQASLSGPQWPRGGPARTLHSAFYWWQNCPFRLLYNDKVSTLKNREALASLEKA